MFVTGQKATTKDSLTVKIMIIKIVKTNYDLQGKIIVKNVSTVPVSFIGIFDLAILSEIY